MQKFNDFLKILLTFVIMIFISIVLLQQAPFFGSFVAIGMWATMVSLVCKYKEQGNG